MQTPVHVPAKRAGIRRLGVLLLGSLFAMWVGLAIYLSFNWPFAEKRVIRDLEHFSSCEVRIRHFRQLYAPHPGYMAEGVVFVRRANGREIDMASVNKMNCASGWISIMLFQHRVRDLEIEGLRVLLPAPVPPAIPFFPSMKDQTTVAKLTANGAVLDLEPRHPGGLALRFAFPKLLLQNVKSDKAISLDTVLDIPTPPGRLRVRGTVGPFPKGRLGATPLSGSFDVERADLSSTNALSGILKSAGAFQGSLGKCQIGGKVRIDGFEVQSVHHPVTLDASFDSTLNGLKGDVVFRSALVRFLGTELQAAGTVETDSNEHGKTESVDVTSNKARIEDLLLLFTKSEPPALKGPIVLQAHIVVPPGPPTFLKKMKLDGSFKIATAEFQHVSTQKSINKLSDRARGQKPKDDELAAQKISSGLTAQVRVRQGTATLAHAEFKTLGATASGGGTYNLFSQAMNMEGKLAIDASLSKAAGGVKSVFLIPLDPFFKKQNAGAVIPFHIGGAYPHPQFHVSLTKGK